MWASYGSKMLWHGFIWLPLAPCNFVWLPTTHYGSLLLPLAPLGLIVYLNIFIFLFICVVYRKPLLNFTSYQTFILNVKKKGVWVFPIIFAILFLFTWIGSQTNLECYEPRACLWKSAYIKFFIWNNNQEQVLELDWDFHGIDFIFLSII